MPTGSADGRAVARVGLAHCAADPLGERREHGHRRFRALAQDRRSGPSPPMTSVADLSTSATTVATRGRSQQHGQLPEVVARAVGAQHPGRPVRLGALHADRAVEQDEQLVTDLALADDDLARPRRSARRRRRRPAAGPPGRGARTAGRDGARASVSSSPRLASVPVMSPPSPATRPARRPDPRVVIMPQPGEDDVDGTRRRRRQIDLDQARDRAAPAGDPRANRASRWPVPGRRRRSSGGSAG